MPLRSVSDKNSVVVACRHHDRWIGNKNSINVEKYNILFIIIIKCCDDIVYLVYLSGMRI